MHAMRLRRDKKQLSRRCGMTLIEVLVAMVICTIALYAVVSVVTAAQTATAKGDAYNIANKAAADAVASAEANGYSTLTDGTTTSPVAGLSNGALTVTIGPLNGNPANTKIKEVDASVTWDGGSGQSQLAGQVSMATCISAP